MSNHIYTHVDVSAIKIIQDVDNELCDYSVHQEHVYIYPESNEYILLGGKSYLNKNSDRINAVIINSGSLAEAYCESINICEYLSDAEKLIAYHYIHGINDAISINLSKKYLDMNIANWIVSLSVDVKVLLSQLRVPLKEFFKLAKCNEKELLKILQFVQKITPSFSNGKLIVELMTELVIIGDKSASEIINDNSIMGLLNNEELPSSIKVKSIIGELRKLRYPKVSSYMNEIAIIANKVRTSKNIKLCYPADLEDNGLELRIKFNTENELENAIALIKENKEQGAIADLLSCINSYLD